MLTIILPAYNEGKHIESLLSKMSDYNILVIDDGSTDNTYDIANSMGYKVVRLENNCGKTRACIEGIKHSKSEFNVFIDADGQLNPKEIPSLVSALENADIVIGERNISDIPFQRKLSNIFARKMVNSIIKKQTDARGVKARYHSDVLCGFRAVRKSAFNKLELKKSSYFFESEMLIEASKQNLRIASVPVSVDYSTGSRMPFKESLKVAVWLMKEAVKNKVR